MNKAILMGRLTRDPDIRYTQGDNPMCIARYTLAVDRRFSRTAGNDGNNADFIPCVCFGKTAEFVEKYLKKGTKMAVTGRIQTGSYTNRDGVKVYTTPRKWLLRTRSSRRAGTRPETVTSAVMAAATITAAVTAVTTAEIIITAAMAAAELSRRLLRIQDLLTALTDL